MIHSLGDIPAVAAYLKRIGAETRSLRTAVIKEQRGNYWTDVAVVHLGHDNKITAPDHYAPTDTEAAAIESDAQGIVFPTLQTIESLTGDDQPDELKNADKKDVFEFRTTENRIVMVQLRVSLPDGGKNYIPWTYWTDNQWRKMEPEGRLPLWGLEALEENSTVFVHEGAKAARAVREMVEARTPETKNKLTDHPWGRELSSAAHLGWIGGALNPSRTDWSELKKSGVRRVYVVTDNDAAGISALPGISYALDLPTFHVQFTTEWPTGFDLADAFPARMFATLAGESRYIGPAFRDCLHPATWATDLVPPPKGKGSRGGGGKPVAVLRASFKDLWAYVEEADMFVCIEMPEIMRTEAILNKQLAPFSHVSETSRLIVRAFRGRTARLCYRPDVEGRVVTDRGSSAINLHVASNVRSTPGDATPWVEFLTYLFPVDEERVTISDWFATLIAKPEIRMHYGLLLVTEHQGIGKTTLGSAVLGPLVGHHNVGWPSENDVAQSAFNGWLANKRLIFVNEIYSGHSWKAYNSLKSMVTDTELEVNQKYQRTYTVENWAHIIACSNSLRALRMEEDDRRWFYPHMTEIAWPQHKFTDLRRWLGSGGLNIVRYWAECRVAAGNSVRSGARAPSTTRKAELITSSRTEGSAEAAMLGEALCGFARPAVVTMQDVVAHVRSQVQGKTYESDHELRKSMVDVGCFVHTDRIKVHGRLQHVIFNSFAKSKLIELNGAGDSVYNATLREMLVQINEIQERTM